MVTTCKASDTMAVPKKNSTRARKTSSSHSSGFRLMDADHLEAASSMSKNSIYKLKIDLMFDDNRTTRSSRLDDPRGSHRTRSIVMYGRHELASAAGESSRTMASFLQESNQDKEKTHAESTKKDVQRMSNSVQAQIEQLFTDVAKDATSSFPVTCLGSLPLKDKVTSLQGLQEPLRDLYLEEISTEKKIAGSLDICASGLRIKIDGRNEDGHITPFHNIAVWSAVKFTVSEVDGGAAFLPLITDPENIDKSSLFQPLSVFEQKRLFNNSHAPIFAVVMRSSGGSKLLECHAFVCKSTEDAIVIAATLYQSLMAHVSSNSHHSTKRRTPRNQNGVSCISIASSSAQTGSAQYLARSQIVAANGRKSSFRSSGGNVAPGSGPLPSRSGRKKRISNSSLSSSSNVINEAVETTTEERKRKSHKVKRAPPVPTPTFQGNRAVNNIVSAYKTTDEICSSSHQTVSSHLKGKGKAISNTHSHRIRQHHHQSIDSLCRSSKNLSAGMGCGEVSATPSTGAVSIRGDTGGDILTRVAIPRSGSFLNTAGLTRYKSRAARRNSGKSGGGGGSPLGFSELFNEFRLHENLHSLDEILYAIIDADGMSFNDLKPIYKEFLLKLSVTLTKDELFQRSKNIMRRQKKKKMKRKGNSPLAQKKRTLLFDTKSLKKVFQLGQFRSCRGKPGKPPRNKDLENKRKSGSILMLEPPSAGGTHLTNQQRSRVATSGSDVSVVRANTGLNRNSSSGYVSFSECSYDSDTCTCVSADRCYCSLKTDQINSKLRRKKERNPAKVKNCDHDNGKSDISQVSNKLKINRQSLISCQSEDKCYCSLAEEEPNGGENDSVNTRSDTTWCDTDSCVSTSKCYCKRRPSNQVTRQTSSDNDRYEHRHHRSGTRKPSDKLALDYELFTVSGTGKSVQPHEALSVKKSVEAAAIFADVKLSQTTDIKSLCPPPSQASQPSNCATSEISSRSQSSSRKYTPTHCHRMRERDGHAAHNRDDRNALISLSSGSHKSSSTDDILSKLCPVNRNKSAAIAAHQASLRSDCNKSHKIERHCMESVPNPYQSMRIASASLEDTLGYLP